MNGHQTLEEKLPMREGGRLLPLSPHLIRTDVEALLSVSQVRSDGTNLPLIE